MVDSSPWYFPVSTTSYTRLCFCEIARFAISSETLTHVHIYQLVLQLNRLKGCSPGPMGTLDHDQAPNLRQLDWSPQRQF